ncbi:MAG: PKD domain-containing protein [Thioalkalivibrio sp.]
MDMYQTTRYATGPVWRGIARVSWVTGLCAMLVMTAGCPSGGGDDTATENAAPVADAGVDQTIDGGTLVQLDGSASSDPDGDALTYQWSQTEGRTVKLSDLNAVNPSFLAPGGMSAEELFRFTLVVNDGELSSSAAAVTVTVRATRPGFLPTMAAALAKGRFTLNNPWTRADLEFEQIYCESGGGGSCFDLDPDLLAYESITGVWQWVRPYTTMITEYEARRRQCEQDYELLYEPGTYESTLRDYNFQDRKCYPTLQVANNLQESRIGDPEAQQVLQRYGYYCGGGFGAQTATFGSNAPEPLDAVDYCCRLHDDQTWNIAGKTFSNECGIAMCLRQATVKGIAALPSDVEQARQHWYGDGIFGGAAFLCPGDQSNDARAPVGE